MQEQLPSSGPRGGVHLDRWINCTAVASLYWPDPDPQSLEHRTTGGGEPRTTTRHHLVTGYRVAVSPFGVMHFIEARRIDCQLL